MRVYAEIVLLDQELFLTEFARLKINYSFRVEGLPHKSCLEVKVRACASASAATVTYYIASLYNIILDHRMSAQVSIIRLQAASVAYDDKVAISARLPRGLDDTYFAVESGPHRVSHLQGYVSALVRAAAAKCITRTHRADNRGDKRASRVHQTDDYLIWHLVQTYPFVGMDGLIIPIILKIFIIERGMTKVNKPPCLV